MRLDRVTSVLALMGLLLGGLLAPAPRVGAAQTEACFAETGQCVRGRFLEYWRANGYPLSAERRELLEDGREYTVQYFERARFELHPENAPPSDVLLGQFGRRFLDMDKDGRYAGPRRAASPNADQVYFPETGHNLGGHFLDYWQANGGLAQFGFPLTEEFSGLLDNTRADYVQYFERARFEYHPENTGTPYEVLLGQFGRQVLSEVDLLTGSFAFLHTTNAEVRQRLGPPMAREAVGARGDSGVRARPDVLASAGVRRWQAGVSGNLRPLWRRASGTMVSLP